MAVYSDFARRKRTTVIVVFVAVILAVVAILSFAILYKTPTCIDKKQNQDEQGIDCGGSCSTLCVSQTAPASVRFTRVLFQSGRTDVIAYIDNPNHDAYAKAAHLTLETYAANGEVARRHISLDLPPGKTTPVFLTGVAPLGTSIRQAFLSFDDGYPVFMRTTASSTPAPLPSGISIENPDTLPRVTATLTNQTAEPLRNVLVIATVLDTSGNAIAASQTVVANLSGQGTAPLIFTWNEPFTAAVARVELVPLSSSPTLLP